MIHFGEMNQSGVLSQNDAKPQERPRAPVTVEDANGQVEDLPKKE